MSSNSIKIDLPDLYERNEDFRTYVNHYCKSYNITKETAFEYLLIQIVARFYVEGEQNG